MKWLRGALICYIAIYLMKGMQESSFAIIKGKKEDHGVGGEDHCKGVGMDGRKRDGRA